MGGWLSKEVRGKPGLPRDRSASPLALCYSALLIVGCGHVVGIVGVQLLCRNKKRVKK